jgi:hypothetical protein
MDPIDGKYHFISSIIRVSQSRIMRQAGHVARMQDIRNSYQISAENLNGRDHLERRGVSERILRDVKNRV